jgi:hypothetical protein
MRAVYNWYNSVILVQNITVNGACGYIVRAKNKNYVFARDISETRLACKAEDETIG